MHDGTGRGALLLALGTSHPVVESRIEWPIDLAPDAAVYSIHGRAVLGRDGDRVVVACGRELWLYDLRAGMAPVAVHVSLHEDGQGRRRQKSGPSPEQKRINELERELRRKDKALAETTALLVLKKKFEALFGDEEDDT